MRNNLGMCFGRLKVVKVLKAGSMRVFNFPSGVIGKNLNEKQVELMEWEDCKS